MDLVKKVKSKKELSGISEEFIVSVIKEIKKKRGFPDILSKKSEKLLIKEVRAELRRYVGQYQKKNKSSDLLNLHASTKERAPYYKSILKEIYDLNPSSILDLGCGLNPLAMARKGTKYYASDINESDLEKVSSFFKENKIFGKVFYQDLRTSRDFPSADVTLIFKVFDLIDKKGHKNAESILVSLNSKNIVVSFSTKKLSGKSMNSPKRNWFEKILSRLNFKFKTLSVPNEIFYFIEKP